VADLKNLDSRVHKVKKNVCMNFNQLCSINYGNTQQKLFFLSSPRVSNLLEDKYKLLSMPFCFVSVFINITRLVPQHGPGISQRY